jgi:hypothetical protein
MSEPLAILEEALPLGSDGGTTEPAEGDAAELRGFRSRAQGLRPRAAATFLALIAGILGLAMIGPFVASSSTVARSAGVRGAAVELRSGSEEDEPAARITSVSNSQDESAIAPASSAKIQEFYMYRPISNGAQEKDAFGNINAANIEGVLWYLMDEVVRTYADGSRCPRKHNISRISRIRIRTMATAELFADTMSMGTLFAYDDGKCMGRCFPDTFCTGYADCDFHFQKYGFVPGCNNSYDKPFPGIDTPAPGVIWYSLPRAGRCDYPTGAHNCTWSYEDAGEITLELLEATNPGLGNCCDGLCTSFWEDRFNASRNSWRTQNAFDMFELMYPEQPRELSKAQCDFQWNKWYSTDPWQSPPEVELKLSSTEAPTSTTQEASTTSSVLPAMEVVHEDATLKDAFGEAPPAPVSSAPLKEFYAYRATTRGEFQHTFGNINVGNLDGVIWYLQNEIVTNYTNGTLCPRKYNISQIRRYKIQTRATEELAAEHMSMGIRFAFNQGKCLGRCFPENMCTGHDDCAFHYEKYGFFPGCNTFQDKYPFPDFDTPAPEGTWYSLPLQGRCDYPTGAHDCTWSYEDAGEVSLAFLELGFPGEGNCCDGKCTGFWDDLFSIPKTNWRVQKALDAFKMLYPSMPRDLSQSRCDFNHTKWYHPNMDPWGRHHPWRSQF